MVSYYAPSGHYASIEDYFALVGVDSPPLHALAEGVDGPNGIYKYAASGGLFSNGGPNTFHSENYLVDVSFERSVAPDTTPPTIGSRSPVGGATSVATEVQPSASFSEAMNPATINGTTVKLKDSLGTQIPATVSYDAVQRKATLEPSEPLDYATAYTATVKGGSSGVADVAGNHLAADSSWSFTTVEPPPAPPDEGPGGPILVISNSGNAFSRYYAEILRAEGLNEFIVTDITNVTPSLLASYDVAILGDGPVSVSQAGTLTSWVEDGGNLIAMRPDAKLASLLGISSAGSTLSNAYLQVDTGTAPGLGIVGQTMQFHGTADRYATAGAQTIATLFSNASTSTSNPAVTLRSVGTKGGHAAAFTYDLAKSVVYTRQGNPAWNEEERDGLSPVRSDDLFFGAKKGAEQPDWVDLSKVEIPQADEQQRLLTNLIEKMNASRKPLPRFWFLPDDDKAAVVMTGDDHGNNGTTGRFEHLESLSPPGCVVAEWKCVRATSYIYPSTPITDAQAAGFVSKGFEIGAHVTTGCRDWDNQADLESFYTPQLAEFAAKFPSLPPPTTNRMHCIVWSDWATQPKVELKNGIRLDTTYYYWPGSWVKNQPGMFTGSGMPMRFANLDGSLADVYQAATQMTDESEQTYPFTAEVLLDNAVGSKGYYGAFVANMHTDKVASPESDAIVAAAQARGVPVVSARQMLTWLDGRNQSSFGSVSWAGSNLSFTIAPGSGARGLRAMVPVSSGVGPLATVVRAGTPVATTTRTIKGIEYAFFDAVAGSYTASYKDEKLPVISEVQASASNDGTATVTWKTDKLTNSRVDYGTSSGSLTQNQSDSALVTSHSIKLSGLAPNTTYYFRVTSADSGGNTITEPDPLLSPKNFLTPPAAPLLSAMVPASPANQNSPKVVGTAAAGTTVRLYATAGCSGSPLATVTAAELAAGAAVSVADNSTTSFRATATSSAGASACSAALAYVEDSAAPNTAISAQPASLAKVATAKFEFSGEDPGGSGIASLECRRDGGTWAACVSGIEYTALTEGSHSFEVRAIDKAGNVDPSPATYAWTIDTIAPDTSIATHPTTPANTAVAKFTFTGNDGSGSGVNGFECRRDAGSWGACTSGIEYSALTEGLHKFEVKALDNADNPDASPASFEWTVDTVAPQPAIDSLSKSLLKAGETSEVSWHANENGSFQLRVGGSDCETGTVLDSGAYGSQPAVKVSTVSAAQLQEGANTLRLCLTDAAANRGQVTTTLNKDTIAPDTAIATNPPALVNTATAKFTFTGNDGSGSGVNGFECRRDAGSWGTCTSGIEYTTLTEGLHKFEVKALDNAGNPDASPASFEWTVDTVAPQPAVDSLSKSLLKAGETSEVSWHANENGSFQLRVGGSDCETGIVLDSGAYGSQPAVKVSTVTAAQLQEGANTLRLCLTDAAANRGQVTTTLNKDTIAPDTAIATNPPALVNTATAKFTFTGNDGSGSGVNGFECRRDAGSWGTCTSGIEYTTLTEGLHKFEVKALDNAGNPDASPASFEWTVDTVAPSTAITEHPAALTNASSAKFEFEGTDAGGSGIGSFQCRQDTADPEAWQPCTSPLKYFSLAEGSHSFEVRALDKAGNADASPASFSWSVDTVAPSAQITASPANLVNVATAHFIFTGSDGSGSGVKGFECRRDAGSWEACASPQDFSGLADGPHNFEVRTIDNAANAGAPASSTWTVDTTAPDTTIATNPAALANTAAAKFTFSGNDGSGSGIASFECRRDAGSWGACTSGIEYPGLTEGLHKFEVKAIDHAANPDASPASFEWTVDTVAPSAQITASPASLVNVATAHFTFTGNDGSGSGVKGFECRRDAGSWEACASPQDFSGLADGSHNFEVRTIDSAANAGAPASSTWTVDTTPPTVQVDSGPNGLTNDATPTFGFSSEPGASLQCSIDTGTPDFKACSDPSSDTPASSLADGTYTFRVRATDAAANQATATRGFSVDATPPDTTIATHPAALASTAAASFTFSGNDGAGSGVASFECRRDAGAWGPCTSGVEYSGLAEGAHSFDVKAIDNAGNQDAIPASFEWTVDTVAPSAQITAQPASLVNVATAHFTFTGNDGSGSGVASFECRRDGGSWGSCSPPQDFTGFADGPHSFEVKALDNAANAGAPASSAWTVDTAAPDTAIATNPPALANTATAKFTFSGNDGSGSGVSSYQCRLDSTQESAWAACASGKEYTALADGAHKFEVRAIDSAANADGSPAAFEWTVDTTPPSAQVDSGPAVIAASADASLAFSGSDAEGSGIASFECRRDGDIWASCSSPRTYSALAEGSHTFEIRAIDKAGNVDPSPATYAWTIDTIAPDTSIATHPTTPANTAVAKFTFTGNDGSGSGVNGFECRRDAGSWGACTSGIEYSALTEGLHKFEVKALDNADNPDASPASFEWTVDTVAPQPAIDSLSKSLLKAGETSEVSWHANENGSFQLRVGGSDCETGTVLDSGAYGSQPAVKVSTVSAAQLQEGANTLRLCLTDAAANRGQVTTTLNKDTIAPDTAIATNPPALASTATAKFTFTGNDGSGSGVNGFECRLDSTEGAAWAACASGIEYATLAEGSHKFEVKALDSAGNPDASPASFEWTVDTTPPSVQVDSGPTGLTNDATPTFGFSSEPGASLQCSIDTGTPDFKACSDPSSHTPASSLADGTYTFRVRATDAAANQATATRDFTVDATLPDTTISTHPASLASTATAKFEFTGNDGSGSGVASLQCRLDSTQEADWGACASGKEYTALADGTHKFEVRALDNAANADGSPASFEWTVDTTAPDTTIATHPATPANVATAKFTFSGNDDAGSGINGFECRRDGGSWALCSSPQDFSGLADGPHSFEVKAIDNAANADQSPAGFSWSVDTVAPSAQIDSHPASLVNVATAHFTFTGDDGAGSGVNGFECRRDSGSWAACASPQDFTGLADGSHSFEVKALDSAANAGAPASATWTVDTTPPSVQVDSGPNGLTNDATPTFAFSSEPGATFECSIDSGTPAFTACTSAYTPASTLADGSYTFRVRATDAAANQATATRSFSVDTAAPQAPTLTATVPASPANNNSPKVTGSAPAGTTVKLYSSSDCPGSPVATVTAAELQAGITVSVPDDSTTSFSATATTAAPNTSGCSQPISYVEDSSAPGTNITANPPTLASVATAHFTFAGSDGSGSGVNGFECRRDGGSWAACSSPQDFSGLAEGSHSFEVRAIDKAGNADQTPASFGWTVDTTAPDTSIATHPATLANTATAQFTFSGNDGSGSGVASLQCRLDSTQEADWGACASGKEYTALADGTHKFEVRALDNAANADGSPASFEWTVDTTAPDTTIATHPATPANVATAKFTFSGNDDAGSGINGFECRRDGGSWALCSSGIEYSGLAEGSHSFEVKAIDNAANADQSPAGFSWSVDTVAPSAQIDSHPASLVNVATAHFTFAGDDGAGSGVNGFECRRDGGSWGACSSPQDFTGLADGSHSFEVKALDNAGNAGAPASYAWTVDTTAPDTLIDLHPASIATSATAKFEFSAADGSGSGVSSFQCRRDAEDWTACSSPRTYTGLAEGTHSLEVRAIDNAGNTDQSPAGFSWTIDTIAPDTTIATHPATLANTATAQFTFSGNDGSGSGVSSYQCRLDSTQESAWAACTSGKEYTALADGTHKFEVRAIDNAGNTDSSPATFEWTVDTVAPTTQITSHPATLVNDATAHFTFSGEDPAGSGVNGFECRRDGGSWAACSSPQDFSGLADGPHSFEVKAIDNAGNPDQSAAEFTWTVDVTPPAVGIDSGPSGLTNDATPTFGFHSGEAGASVECSIDTGTPDFKACSDPNSHTPSSPLADGAYTFRVRATDVAGNQATATRSFKVDTTAPTAPQLTATVPASPANNNSPKVTGTASAGTTVKLYASADCSGSPVATVTAAELETGITVSVPDDSTTSFSATATTVAANTSGCSQPITYVEDSSAPGTNITAHPATLASVATASFSFSGEDPGGSGVNGFECRRDAGSWAACASPQDFSGLAEGAHSFEVRALDKAGNVDASPASFTWTVDTAAPDTTIATHPATLTNTATAQFTFSGNDGSGSGVASLQCRLDSSQEAAWAACTSGKEYTALAEGTHKFEVRAIDNAGNADSSPAAFEWTVDTAAPDTTVATHPATLTNTATAQFTFSGNDGSGSGVNGFECRRDDGAWAACTSGIEYSGLAEGIHNFEVKAIDKAANADQSPASFSWTVDTVAPSAQIDSHPASLVNVATAHFTFSGNDGSGSGIASFECRRDSGSWAACASPQDFTGLADGSHSFEVKALDSAANAGAPASATWTVDTTPRASRSTPAPTA